MKNKGFVELRDSDGRRVLLNADYVKIARAVSAS